MLSKADAELMSEPSSSWVLKERLHGVRDAFDFIIVDCPPTLTLLTLNALSAADRVLIPVKTDYLSIMGVPLLFETITKIQKRGNSTLGVLGVLPTLYNPRNTHDNAILHKLRDAFGAHTTIFAPIHRSTAFDKAASAGKPTLAAPPHTAPGAENYYKLADFILAYEHW